MARNPKKQLTKVPLIMRGRAFMSFYDFEKNKKYTELKDQLNEKKYPVSKTDASYRTINSWSDAGLLFGEEDRKSGWRKFSFLDIFWLEILIELRAVGFSLKKLLKLKDCLFDNKYVEKAGDTTFLAFYCAYTQVEDVRLIVLSDGEGTLAFAQEYQASVIAGLIPTTHAVININSIFAKLAGHQKYKSVKNPTGILDKNELQLISKIKFEDVSEVKAKVKDNKVTRISYETLISKPKNTIDEIRKILETEGNREITIYQEGKRGYQIKRVDKM